MSKKRLTRADWVNAAMQVLLTGGGIDHVKVDNLAKALKITRGSFYYHYESRADFIKDILETWRKKATDDVIINLRGKTGNPREQLHSLVVLPLKGQKSFDAASIEMSLRAWARRDENARATVEEIDNYRVSFIQSLFTRLGQEEQEAEDSAFLLYSYLISISQLHVDNKNDELKNRSIRIVDNLIDR